LPTLRSYHDYHYRAGDQRRAQSRRSAPAPPSRPPSHARILVCEGDSCASAHNWIATGWNIHLVDQAQPGTAAHFFNTPGSYGTGSNPTIGTVTDAFRATPTLLYTSNAQFVSDINNGEIPGQYQWVLYDPEY